MGGYPQRGLHGHVVQVVGQRIARGELSPGDPIDVDELETEFGVSRTVVRESLKVLAAKGLVDARPKRGTFVRPRADWSLLDPDLLRWQYEGRVDAAFLDNLAEVRAIVEPAGARLAASRRTVEDLAALERALAGMSTGITTGTAGEENKDTAIAADLAFHRALLFAAHNELLERMEVVIEAGLRTHDHLVYESAAWESSIPTHRIVLEAVRAGDADRAEQGMREILRIAQEQAAGFAKRQVPIT